jgi:hypothetical protein
MQVSTTGLLTARASLCCVRDAQHSDVAGCRRASPHLRFQRAMSTGTVALCSSWKATLPSISPGPV